MKNLCLVCMTIILCNNLISAQNHGISKINLYLEAGTIVAFSSASVNIEAPLVSSASGKVHLYGRAGYGGANVFFGPAGLGGLGGLTMLTGKYNHHFEVSGGAFLGNNTEGMGSESVFVLPLLDLGYRFQNPGKSFLFRAKAGILGVGIGLGYAF